MGFKRMLEDIVGDEGYNKLSKAIYKQRSQSVVDPSEQLLGLLTAPRAVISWLVTNLRPMKLGEVKELAFPGRPDIIMNVEKQDIDVYRAEFVQAGQVIHRFEKQSLPAVASHIVTTGELYEIEGEGEVRPHDPPKPGVSKAPKTEAVNTKLGAEHGVISAILEANNAMPASTGEDMKWMWAHANIRELSGVIGKLVDALVEKHKSKKDSNTSMDKKEIKGDEQKVIESDGPSIIASTKERSIDKDKSVIQESKLQYLTHKLRSDIKKEELGKVRVNEPLKKPHSRRSQPLKPSEQVLQNPQAYKDWVRSQRERAETATSRARQISDITRPIRYKAIAPPKTKRLWSKLSTAWRAEHDEAQRERAKFGKTPVQKSELCKGKVYDFSTKKQIFPKKSVQTPKEPLLQNLPKPKTKETDDASNWRFHRSHGLGRVVGTEERSFGLGTPSMKFHVMEIRDGDTPKKVYVDSRNFERNTRPLISVEDADRAQAIALSKPEPSAIAGKPWHVRYRSYMDTIHSGDPMDLAKLIRDLSGRKITNKNERRLLDMARSTLFGEIARVKSFYAKAEKPAGAGIPKPPQAPKPPEPPVPPSNQPKAAATRQAKEAGRGRQQKPPRSNMKMPTQAGAPPTFKGELSQGLRRLGRIKKSERSFVVTEAEIFSPCLYCNVPEFVKSEGGTPKFNPCYCFYSECVDTDGNYKEFANIKKKENGHYSISFNRNADPDSVVEFLRTLKQVLYQRYKS